MNRFLALCLSAAGSLAVLVGDAAAVEYLLCESDDGRFRRCPVRSEQDLRGLDIRVVDRLSHASCQEGHTWGVERDQIWVDRGCRAKFSIDFEGRYRDHSRNHRFDWDRDNRYHRHDSYDHYDRHSPYDDYYRPRRTEQELRYYHDRSRDW